ncbi:MAG: EAL domain-containing protein [Lachnospiraceae bacterium]|nr:EAL domain-containing protein [Lachnospiraceae bacterium]
MDNNIIDLSGQLFEAYSRETGNSYIFYSDLKKKYSRWSRNAVAFFGLSDEIMDDLGEEWESHVHPDDLLAFRKSINAVMSGYTDTHHMEYRARAQDGSYVIVTCTGTIIKDSNGEPAIFAGTLINHGLTDSYDPVTGLNNIDEFMNLLHRKKTQGSPYDILLIGVRDYDKMNDTYGFSYASAVLKEIAGIFKTYAGELGMLFRLDGVKLALCMDPMNEATVKNFYYELQRHFKNDVICRGTRIPIEVGGGYLQVHDLNLDVQTIYTSIQFALRSSKREHGGELITFREGDNKKNYNTLELMNAIRSSVHKDCEGFYLVYQPVVSSKTEELVGMEALLRWRGEPFGNVPPNDFIPWLERDALFFELGNWILERAMRDGKAILDKYPDFVINVNLAYSQLERPEFASHLLRIIDEVKYPHSNLCLELTERCRFLDTKYLRDQCILFKSYGIKIALDDFGTGFSALSILRDLPVDTIKIDRSFVKDIETNKTDQTIVSALTACAKNMNVHVCVEGVETESMADFLRTYHATSFQGYLYSKPVAMEDFVRLPIY